MLHIRSIHSSRLHSNAIPEKTFNRFFVAKMKVEEYIGAMLSTPVIRR
jgi:hypothetical protein